MLQEEAIPNKLSIPGEMQVSQRRRTIRALVRNTGFLIGGFIVSAAVLCALLADLLAPQDPYLTDLANYLQPPGSPGHILGTDELGRDIASRLIYGARVSLGVGLVAAFFASTTGLIVGAVSGFFGGWLDTIIMRIIDVMLSFPYILLAIVIVAVVGPSLLNTLLAIAVLGVPFYVRVVRAEVLTIIKLEYVTAARVLGCTDLWILIKTIMPNVLSPVITAVSLDVGWLILQAASLSFLGLGTQPPTAEWGAMLASSRQYFILAPHVAIIPGLSIFILVLGCNLLGDGLRDALDPRLRSR